MVALVGSLLRVVQALSERVHRKLGISLHQESAVRGIVLSNPRSSPSRSKSRKAVQLINRLPILQGKAPSAAGKSPRCNAAQTD